MTTRKEFIKDLDSKSIGQLTEMLEKYQKEQYELTIKKSLRSLNQTHLIKEKRRDIARIKTVLHAKRHEG